MKTLFLNCQKLPKRKDVDIINYQSHAQSHIRGWTQNFPFYSHNHEQDQNTVTFNIYGNDPKIYLFTNLLTSEWETLILTVQFL